MKKVLYPGSFDPITYGHMDVIDQALLIFDKVVVGVLINGEKSRGMFDINERKRIIEKIYSDNPRVEVVAMEDNVAAVDVALDYGCHTIARGLRDLTDFAKEINLSTINFKISDSKVNTVAFFANPGKVTVSSTMVRELSRLNKDISNYVHPLVKEAIEKKKGDSI